MGRGEDLAYGVERGLEIEPRDLVIVHHRLEASDDSFDGRLETCRLKRFF